jgi:hypothetical protein
MTAAKALAMMSAIPTIAIAKSKRTNQESVPVT